LDINDIPEVLNETKKVFAGLVNGSLNVGQNICLEISLHTVEGENMILETWWMTVNDTVDPSARVSYTVYNRMGTLIKSLICATRVVPAYRLSRKQGPDTFVVCYRIYTGEPQFHLGAGYQKTKVGAVPTPTRTIVLSVAYRTKMLLSPQTSLQREMPFEVKDDHFMENSPQRQMHEMPIPCHILHKEVQRR
jgi:autophagy-related protein 13